MVYASITNMFCIYYVPANIGTSGPKKEKIHKKLHSFQLPLNLAHRKSKDLANCVASSSPTVSY